MKRTKFGILIVIALLALVSVASAALPAQVTATLERASGPYWEVAVTSGVTPELPAGSVYSGWCSDILHSIEGTNDFTAYSSITGGYPSDMPTADWNKLNYIINNPHEDWRITQAAIWHYDGEPTGFPDSGDVSGYSEEAFTAYIGTVDQNGANFVPRCGQLYAVILYRVGYQVIIVERPTPECQNAPEFPTLALPVAMLIGVAGAVQYVRARKE